MVYLLLYGVLSTTHGVDTYSFREGVVSPTVLIETDSSHRSLYFTGTRLGSTSPGPVRHVGPQ